MNNFLHSINIICEKYTIILEYENFLSQMLVMKHEKLTEEFYLAVHSTKEVLLKCYIWLCILFSILAESGFHLFKYTTK